MSLTIRPLTATDRANWDALWAAYLAFYETTLPPEIYDTAFARLLSNDVVEFHGLLALQDNRPIGLAHYLFHRDLWRVENICYLQDLFVTPDARGTGAGRALIDATTAAALAKGAPTLYWLTQGFNTTARRLYDRTATLTPFVVYEKSIPPK